MSDSTTTLKVARVQGLEKTQRNDVLAVEEPLEIRLNDKTISITMRTPGHDFELAAGFLFTEGILKRREDLQEIRFCGPSGNVVRVELRSCAEIDHKRLERHFYTSSSCGVCGKTSIEALRTTSANLQMNAKFKVSAEFIHELPSKQRASQGIFESTGALHASTIFNRTGELISIYEDVGRHNALDKLVGDAFLNERLPLAESVLLVSGRASFELVQKAAMAGIPIFAAVGAPSSLAVELARDVGMTVLGFVRENRFNIYSAEERILNHG